MGEDDYRMVLARLEALERGLPSMMGESVENAIRSVMQDREVRKAFWHDGYEELREHASIGASQYIGKRFLTAIITAIVAWGMVWLLRSGGKL